MIARGWISVLACVAIACGALTLGARQVAASVHAMVCGDMKAKYHTEVSNYGELSATDADAAYFCRARLVAPFVADVSWGYHCGALCSEGYSGYAVLIPSVGALPVYQRFSWGS